MQQQECPWDVPGTATVAIVAWKTFGLLPSKRLKVGQLSDIVLSALLRPKLAYPVRALHWNIWDVKCCKWQGRAWRKRREGQPKGNKGQ